MFLLSVLLNRYLGVRIVAGVARSCCLRPSSSIDVRGDWIELESHLCTGTILGIKIERSCVAQP